MYHHARTRLQLRFRYLEPSFFSGLLDDPVLLLRNRPAGSNLLIDCGQIHHLAKRVLKAVDAIFISHAHMDHFMGLTTFVRNILVSTKTVDIFGPPGLALRMENLLSGFDWNLSEDFWCSLRVNEIGADTISIWLLPGPRRFRRQAEGTAPRTEPVIYRDGRLKVSSAACDHKIPSLIYRVDEEPAFIVDDEKLGKIGLARGDWLKELNRRYNRGTLDEGPISVLTQQEGGTATVEIASPADLYRQIRAEQETLSIGYVCDAGYSPDNIRVMRELLDGVTLLVCECTYSAADRDKARASYHLCTTDLNRLMADLSPRFVLPIHVSKSYTGETGRIFDELTPPANCRLLRLPDHIAPRPLLPDELPAPDVV